MRRAATVDLWHVTSRESHHPVWPALPRWNKLFSRVPSFSVTSPWKSTNLSVFTNLSALKMSLLLPCSHCISPFRHTQCSIHRLFFHSPIKIIKISRNYRNCCWLSTFQATRTTKKLWLLMLKCTFACLCTSMHIHFSTYPRILISTYPHIHISTYPHFHASSCSCINILGLLTFPCDTWKC